MTPVDELILAILTVAFVLAVLLNTGDLPRINRHRPTDAVEAERLYERYKATQEPTTYYWPDENE